MIRELCVALDLYLSVAGSNLDWSDVHIARRCLSRFLVFPYDYL
jgi:hypothetical protein